MFTAGIALCELSAFENPLCLLRLMHRAYRLNFRLLNALLRQELLPTNHSIYTLLDTQV